MNPGLISKIAAGIVVVVAIKPITRLFKQRNTEDLQEIPIPQFADDVRI